MKITVETNFPEKIISDELPEGVQMTLPMPDSTRDPSSAEQLFTVIYTFSSSIAASLFASWLYDKLKNRPNLRLKINRKEVTIDKENIVKVITEEIEIGQD